MPAVISTIEEQTAEISDYYVHEIDTMQKVVEVTAEYVGTRGTSDSRRRQRFIENNYKENRCAGCIYIMNDGTVFNSVGEVPPIMKNVWMKKFY